MDTMANADESLFDLDIRVSSFGASQDIPDRPATQPGDFTCDASGCDGTCGGDTCAPNYTCATCGDTCTCVPNC